MSDEVLPYAPMTDDEARLMDLNEARKRFMHHPPSHQVVVETHEMVRSLHWTLAEFLIKTLPDCEERAKALDHLDYSCMLANATIARTQLNLDLGDGKAPEAG